MHTQTEQKIDGKTILTGSPLLTERGTFARPSLMHTMITYRVGCTLDGAKGMDVSDDWRIPWYTTDCTPIKGYVTKMVPNLFNFSGNLKADPPRKSEGMLKVRWLVRT